MPIEQEVNLTKDGIEDFEIVFFVPGPGNTNDPQAGVVNFQILMSDGSIRPGKPVDLLDKLTEDAAGLVHLANLADLRDYMRARLNSEALP